MNRLRHDVLPAGDTAAETAVSDGVFVSYRREDSSHVAGRLYDRLCDEFGEERVFMDVDTIEPGVDFTKVIAQRVQTCAALLAVIGPEWLTVRNATGPRLQDSSDYVRLEIEAALRRDVRVVPILVENATMPRADQLPQSLAPLSLRHAITLDHESFRTDSDRLLHALTAVMPTRPHPSEVSVVVGDRRWATAGRWLRGRRRLVSAMVVVVTLFGLLGAWQQVFSGGRTDSNDQDAAAWRAEPAMVQALEAGAVAVFRGRLYVIGGYTPTGIRHPLDYVQVYDPVSRRWALGPTLPRAVNHAAAVATRDSLYVLGGMADDGSTEAVFRLDDPEGRWVSDRPLPEARGAAAAAFDGERIVFAGGVGRDGLAKSDVWTMVPGQEWAVGGQLLPAREKLAAATDGYNRVWFLGGRDIRAAPGEKTYGAVDIVTKTEVHHLGEKITPVSGPAGAEVPGQGMCTVGGQNADGTFVLELRCLAEGEGALRDLPQPRAGAGAAVLQERLYVAGGYYPGANGSSTVFSIALPTL